MVVKEQFGSKQPSGVMGTLKYLKAMKKVFIDFGGVAWGWKLAAMELLEVVSQSLVVSCGWARWHRAERWCRR